MSYVTMSYSAHQDKFWQPTAWLANSFASQSWLPSSIRSSCLALPLLKISVAVFVLQPETADTFTCRYCHSQAVV